MGRSQKSMTAMCLSSMYYEHSETHYIISQVMLTAVSGNKHIVLHDKCCI